MGSHIVEDIVKGLKLIGKQKSKGLGLVGPKPERSKERGRERRALSKARPSVSGGKRSFPPELDLLKAFP